MKKNLRFFMLAALIAPFIIYGQQPENPGFENWEDVGNSIMEPVDWSTIKTADDPGIGDLAPTTFERSTDYHGGNYSLKLYNVQVFPGLVATGAITNGMFHAEYNLDSSFSYTKADDPQWHTPFAFRPDSLTGWFKFFPNGNDIAQFKVILHVDECKLPENGTLPNWVGIAVHITEPGVEYENWTRFSVPFSYFNENIPEYELTVMNSGDSTIAADGSYLLVDDLQFIYGPQSIPDFGTQQSFLIVEDHNLLIQVESTEEYFQQWFYLIDMAGKTVLAEKLESNLIILPGNIKDGIYVAVLNGKSGQYVQKITIF